MLNRRYGSILSASFFVFVCLGADSLAQVTVPELQKFDNLVLDTTDFISLDQGDAVIKVLPALNNRDIAVRGVVRLQASAEMFLESFRDNMTRKSNPAILEIGRLGNSPALEDFQALTIEDRDIEDLRQCVVGDCQVKLSAPMIERLQKEVAWSTENYRIQVTQLLKQMLIEYVRDYLARGDEALIRYSDKSKAIRLADEQRELMAASSYESLLENRSGPSKPELTMVENAIVWSKIKFGLKPVLAINHIMIYQRAHKPDPEILVVSKQIYASHYFDSSLAITAFMELHGPNPGSYLIYENRSRVDGLEGPFGKIKRGIIESKAVSSLRAILHQSQLSLAAIPMKSDSSVAAAAIGWNWRRWKVSRINLVISLLWVSAFVMFFGLRAYGWKSISR